MKRHYNFENPSPSEDNDVDMLSRHTSQYNLTVWNDEVNTFDWVTQTLVEVCDHEKLQAEQCTIIIHYNGKCAVKNGEYNTLKPMKDEIVERGINATIETGQKN